MSWTKSTLQYEYGRWVIRLGPCFVVDAKPEVLNLCLGANKKLKWVLNQPESGLAKWLNPKLNRITKL